MSAGTEADGAPPLVALLRQVSSEARAGRITPQQKQAFKKVLSEVAAVSGASNADSASAAPPAPTSTAADSKEPRHLVPLLRQVSAIERQHIITPDLKAKLRVSSATFCPLCCCSDLCLLVCLPTELAFERSGR
jgi:hypothetical protein